MNLVVEAMMVKNKNGVNRRGRPIIKKPVPSKKTPAKKRTTKRYA